MTSLTCEQTVGQLATEHPLATRVFARHGIDYCCGGGLPLSRACEQRGLDATAVLAEIEHELASSVATPERWDDAPLEALIDHILATYHAPLEEELPRIEEMAVKVSRVHGDKAPDVLPEIESIVVSLREEMEQHMKKEELILFPMIRQGRGAEADGPVSVMEHEHADVGNALRRLRELTGGYTVPEGACNTWRALWHGLADLERATHEHIHLENNILFPRALAS